MRGLRTRAQAILGAGLLLAAFAAAVYLTVTAIQTWPWEAWGIVACIAVLLCRRFALGLRGSPTEK